MLTVAPDGMHTPLPPKPARDDETEDSPPPVVPPDQAPDLVPQRDPPKPGDRRPEPPMRVGGAIRKLHSPED